MRALYALALSSLWGGSIRLQSHLSDPAATLADPVAAEAAAQGLENGLNAISAMAPNAEANDTDKIVLPKPFLLPDFNVSMFDQVITPDQSAALAAQLEAVESAARQKMDELEAEKPSKDDDKNIAEGAKSASSIDPKLFEKVERILGVQSRLYKVLQSTVQSLQNHMNDFEDKLRRKEEEEAKARAAEASSHFVTIKIATPGKFSVRSKVLPRDAGETTSNETTTETDIESSDDMLENAFGEVPGLTGDVETGMKIKDMKNPIPVMIMQAEPLVKLEKFLDGFVASEQLIFLLRLSSIRNLIESNSDLTQIRRELEKMKDTLEAQVKFVEADADAVAPRTEGAG